MRFVGDNLIRGDLERWEMVAQKCSGCGKIAYPMKRVCPECFGEDLAELPLGRHGTLHTFTVTHVGPPELNAPYILAMADIPEGLKLMGQVMSDPLNHGLTVGMPIEIVLDKLRVDPDGEDVYSFKFKPMENAQ